MLGCCVFKLVGLKLVVKMMSWGYNWVWMFFIFYRIVFDIYDVFDVIVFDEDKRGVLEFLGWVVILLL